MNLSFHEQLSNDLINTPKIIFQRKISITIEFPEIEYGSLIRSFNYYDRVKVLFEELREYYYQKNLKIVDFADSCFNVCIIDNNGKKENLVIKNQNKFLFLYEKNFNNTFFSFDKKNAVITNID